MRYSVVTVSWVLVIALSPLFAQSTLPPGTIDGAIHPEQIPDVVAWRLFFGALDEKPNHALTTGGAHQPVSVTPTATQAAKLRPVMLSVLDTFAVLKAVQNWDDQLANAVPPAGMTAPNTHAFDLDLMTQAVVDALRPQMSPDGFALLLAYVRTQKKTMKRIPIPMAQHSH